MKTLAVGTEVRVIDPSLWVAEVARKITDRVGKVVQVRELGTRSRNVNADYIVLFPKLGRRKEFKHHFKARDLRIEEDQTP